LIVVDSSAVIEITLQGSEESRCINILETADRVAMSAATLTETLIVAGARDKLNAVHTLLGRLSIDYIPLTETRALEAAEAYRRWGKGFHPAKLNFGDCFAYALAKERACPLLYVGKDFAATDVEAAR
jgi:ribonuclease VapC